MRAKKRDSSTERRILIAMITNKSALAGISSQWEDGLFQVKWSNLIAQWCVDFFNEYNEAPLGAIEGIYESWANSQPDDDTAELVDKFLVSLSGEYEEQGREVNAGYVIDLAGEHFNSVKLKRLSDAVQGDISTGNTKKALLRVNSFSHLEIGRENSVDVFNDSQAFREAFEESRESLVNYPQALKYFFQDALERDAFIAFMGPEKRGKTWWLLDVAFRSALQRRRVAFFEVGDMSQKQILKRFATRVAKRPMKAKKIEYPVSIDRDGGTSKAVVETEMREWKKALSWQEAYKNAQRAVKAKIKSKDSYFRLSVHPNNSISVVGIQSILQTWENTSGWVPDVIVIDYADILAPVSHSSDSRDAINDTWKRLRGLSQERHCLVVTATQADAASYKQDTIDSSNFSEDKRKLAHVTGMVGINSSEAEKEFGLQRLNWIVLRESDFNSSRCVHVAGCLDVGNPAILSTF